MVVFHSELPVGKDPKTLNWSTHYLHHSFGCSMSVPPNVNLTDKTSFK